MGKGFVRVMRNCVLTILWAFTRVPCWVCGGNEIEMLVGGFV